MKGAAPLLKTKHKHHWEMFFCMKMHGLTLISWTLSLSAVKLLPKMQKGSGPLSVIF